MVICACISGADTNLFHSSSDIQKKLKELFPRDYATEYRKFRPLDRQQMNTRLRSVRRKPRIGTTSPNDIEAITTFKHHHEEVFEGPHTAFRTPNHEAETISPSLLIAQPLRQSDVPPTNPRIPLEVTSLGKSVVPNVLSGAELVNPSLLLLDGSSIAQTSPYPIEGLNMAMLNSVRDTRSDARRRADFGLRSSVVSFRSLELRLQRRSRSFVSQVDSIVRSSRTVSWCSSVSWGSRWILNKVLPDPDTPATLDDLSTTLSNQQNSGAFSQSKDGVLTAEERRIWNKLIQKAEFQISCYSDDDELKVDRVRELSGDIHDYGRVPHVKICCPRSTVGKGKCLECGSNTIHRRLLAPPDGDLPVQLSPDLINDPDNLGNTPLHYAAIGWARHPNSLRGLLALGMKCHLRNVFGQTFLHILLGHVSCADLPDLCDLLQYLKGTGFDFTTRDFHGRTAVLHFFASAIDISEQHLPDLERVLQITKHELATVDSRCESLTHHMNNLAKGQICPTKLKAFISAIPVSRNSRLNFGERVERSKNWSTYLPWVLKHDRSTWVDSRGDTPIIALIKCWDYVKDDERKLPPMIKDLVLAGADIHMRDKKGDTALCLAVARGLRPAVVALLDLGASQYSRRYNGTTIIDNGVAELCRAGRNANDQLYAMILSCIAHLSDRSATDMAIN